MNVFRARVIVDDNGKHFDNTVITLADNIVKARDSIMYQFAPVYIDDEIPDGKIRICNLEDTGVVTLSKVVEYPFVRVISRNPIYSLSKDEMRIFKMEVIIDNGVRTFNNTVMAFAKDDSTAVANIRKQFAKGADETIEVLSIQDLGKAELRTKEGYADTFAISTEPVV